MTKKKILILLGHSDNETTCGSFATAYEEGAKETGYEVKRVNLGDLKFDPILHKGYKVIQELEPDLLALQNDFRWAEHIVLFYP
ncbi:MAG: NAD(P)H-dependent oxidoreductase, partial [Patescibacteria group bacterium]